MMIMITRDRMIKNNITTSLAFVLVAEVGGDTSTGHPIRRPSSARFNYKVVGSIFSSLLRRRPKNINSLVFADLNLRSVRRDGQVWSRNVGFGVIQRKL